MCLTVCLQDWQILVGAMQASFMKLGIILGGSHLDLPTVHGAGMALIDKGYAWSLAIQGSPQRPSAWESDVQTANLALGNTACRRGRCNR